MSVAPVYRVAAVPSSFTLIIAAAWGRSVR